MIPLSKHHVLSQYIINIVVLPKKKKLHVKGKKSEIVIQQTLCSATRPFLIFCRSPLGVSTQIDHSPFLQVWTKQGCCLAL